MSDPGPSSKNKEGSLTSISDTRHLIKPGSQLLIRLPTKDVRNIRIDDSPGEKTVNLGKFGNFKQKYLVGQPYGLSYELQGDKTLATLPPKRLEELEETGATNELIVDGGQLVQPLTFTEIDALKKSGLHASEIIKKQIETHANFDLKTEYSKDKYKKRKQAKFSKEITVLDPSLFNVASYFFEKDPARIMNMRVDTLGQMANLANLRPGGRFIIVDAISGLLVATALERLGGSGRVLYLSEADTPPQFPILNLLNMPEENISILTYMDWAAADEEHDPIRAPFETDTGEYRSIGQKERYEKRKAAIDTFDQLREELFAGNWDGLLIAAQYEPFSIVQRLTPYLAGSATITIYSPFIQVLSEVQVQMRPLPAYLNPSITEAWLRQYQVLPGRTHPMMNMTGGGGYILHSTHVYDDPKALSALAGMRQRARERRAQNPAPSVTKAKSTNGGDIQGKDGDDDVEMSSVGSDK